MFLYSKYNKDGVESPERLVHLVANTGIQALCLIDRNGKGLVSFLASCQKRKVKASIAIPFSCFLEGTDGKQMGYLIAGNFDAYRLAKDKIEEISHDFIPFMSKGSQGALGAKGIYCLVKRRSGYQDAASGAHIPIQPIAYTGEQQKRSAIASTGVSVGETIEDAIFSPTAIIFVEGVGGDAASFLKAYEKANKSTNLLQYKQNKAFGIE